MATEADIELVPALLKGIPALRTLQYADRNDVDLVVTGTHGPTGLGWLFLGSVTERITRNADVPVLTINLPDAESTVADAEQANEIAREALETEGYTDISFPKDPSRTHGSWIIRATNGKKRSTSTSTKQLDNQISSLSTGDDSLHLKNVCCFQNGLRKPGHNSRSHRNRLE